MLEAGLDRAVRGDRQFLGRFRMLLAWAHADLGNVEEGRRSLALAERLFDDLLYDGWDPWRGSVIERLFHMIQAKLAD